MVEACKMAERRRPSRVSNIVILAEREVLYGVYTNMCMYWFFLCSVVSALEGYIYIYQKTSISIYIYRHMYIYIC